MAQNCRCRVNHHRQLAKHQRLLATIPSNSFEGMKPSAVVWGRLGHCQPVLSMKSERFTKLLRRSSTAGGRRRQIKLSLFFLIERQTPPFTRRKSPLWVLLQVFSALRKRKRGTPRRPPLAKRWKAKNLRHLSGRCIRWKELQEACSSIERTTSSRYTSELCPPP